jgi:hypothetical protein
MELNWPLIWRTARYIIWHPENWDQSDWEHCFAGHAIRMDGWTPVRYTGYFDCDTQMTRGGLRMELEDAARRSLGISAWTDSHALFGADRSLSNILSTLYGWALDDGEEMPGDIDDAWHLFAY